MTKEQTEQTIKFMAKVCTILIRNIDQCGGSNDQAWSKSQEEVMELIGVDRLKAINIMRASMSCYLGEVHPIFSTLIK